MRWMKHLSLAHADDSIGGILELHGAEGYGVWWLILEDIAAPMEPGKMTPSAAHSLLKWAQICHCSTRRFRSIANSLAEKSLILIETDLERIRIEVPNILKYKDEYSKRSGETPEQEQIQKQRESREKTDTDKPDEVADWYNSEFYPIFPLHKSRESGLKAARVHLKTPELRAEALAAIQRQLPEYEQREPSKRPYPATWINGKRWEDEPPPLFVEPVNVQYESATDRAIAEGMRRIRENGRL